MAEAIETPAAVETPATTPTPNPTDEAARKAREAEIKKRGAELKAEKDGLNKQRSEILAEQKKLEAERAEIAEFKRWKSQATIDPDAFLKPIYGESWRDTLAKHTTGDSTPLQIQQLRAEWETERKARTDADAKAKADADAKLEADKKAKEEADVKSFTDYKTHISTKWIEENGDKFPSIKATGTAYVIADKVRAVHMETGKLPDEMEVAKTLEEELDKLLDTVYTTPKWSEKLAQKFKPAAPVAKPKAPPQYVEKPRTPQGISQQMSQGTKAAPILTREQRKAAIASMSEADFQKKVDQVRGVKLPADE